MYVRLCLKLYIKEVYLIVCLIRYCYLYVILMSILNELKKIIVVFELII